MKPSGIGCGEKHLLQACCGLFGAVTPLEPRSQGVQYPHLEKGARWRPYTPGAGLGLQLLFLRGSPLPLFSRHASTSPQKRQSQLLTAEAPAPSTTLLSQKWLRTCSQSPASLSSHDLISTLRNLKTPLCPTPVFFVVVAQF